MLEYEKQRRRALWQTKPVMNDWAMTDSIVIPITGQAEGRAVAQVFPCIGAARQAHKHPGRLRRICPSRRILRSRPVCWFHTIRRNVALHSYDKALWIFADPSDIVAGVVSQEKVHHQIFHPANAVVKQPCLFKEGLTACVQLFLVAGNAGGKRAVGDVPCHPAHREVFHNLHPDTLNQIPAQVGDLRWGIG